MSTPKEIIEKNFDSNTCRYLLDSWHRSLYYSNCNCDFKLFYFQLASPQRFIINNWITDSLVKFNLWQNWEMPIIQEIIAKTFNASICRSILDSWHRSLYLNTCKSDFKLFYFQLASPQKIIINNWISDCLVKYNLWQKWDMESDIVTLENITIN